MKITIIGAGLTGLTLAYLLKKNNQDCKLLDGRQRPGGRIFTHMSGNHIPVDLGAAWFWDYNPLAIQLLKDLNIGSFEQYFGDKVWYQPHHEKDFALMDYPDSSAPSYRIDGGSTNLILTLASFLDPDCIELDSKVLSISKNNTGFKIKTTVKDYASDIVICAIPPALIPKITFDPPLPDSYLDIAHHTHTWMQDSIKFGLGYSQNIWKALDKPITSFSNTAPASEVYEYVNKGRDRFGIMGFFNPNTHLWTADKRKDQVLNQLADNLGDAVYEYVSYQEYHWGQSPFTKSPDSIPMPPHHNNGHHVLRSRFYDDRLIMAGSETSEVLPGYMEGAINSAINTFKIIKGL